LRSELTNSTEGITRIGTVNGIPGTRIGIQGNVRILTTENTWLLTTIGAGLATRFNNARKRIASYLPFSDDEMVAIHLQMWECGHFYPANFIPKFACTY